MSTPMSNLRKSKKTPLPTASGGLSNLRSVPFRTGPGYTVDESKLLDEITTNMAASRLNRSRESTSTSLPKLVGGSNETSPRSKKSSDSNPSDTDLMSIMMARLSQLEQKVQHQSKEISEKNKKLKVLEDKVRLLKNVREAETDGRPGQVKELERKCLLLQQQVHEMETFLADYGMVWVGVESDPESDVYSALDINDEEVQTEEDGGPGLPTDLWRPSTSVAGPEFKVDYDQIIHNVQELNILAGEGVAKIQHTTDGARLKLPDSVPLTLYANGILLYNGPFRPFTDSTTRQYLKDITDGFFPSELQIRYPDGVPISVTDKRNVYFKDKRNIEVFQGTGQILGGETRPSRLVPSNLNHENNPYTQPYTEETSELPGKKMSMEQFLHKLPQNVIKDGKVIDVRSDLGAKLTGGGSTPNDTKVIETSAVREMKERLEQSERDRPPSSRNVTTLRIKSERGDQNFILKMKFSETIGDVRRHLEKNRPFGAPSFKIMSAFPSKTYEDDNVSLQECGLVPNAALHLVARKK